MEYGPGGSASSYHSEEQDWSELCIPVKELETKPQLIARRLFRGKVQHTSNQSRGKKSAHDHQTFCESYCSQQKVQSKLNLRLSVFTDKSQGNGECDRGDDTRSAMRLDSASDSNWIGGPTKTRTTRKLLSGAMV